MDSVTHTGATRSHSRGRGNKTILSAVRALQFIFAAILVGIFAWFHRRMITAAGATRAEVDVPLGFSVAALLFVIWSLINMFFIHERSPLSMFVTDFVLFVGFLASAIVYRNNFNTTCSLNSLVGFFSSIGRSSCNIVRLGAASLVIQTILFFISMILSFLLSRHHRNSYGAGSTVHEGKGRSFGRRRGHATAV